MTGPITAEDIDVAAGELVMVIWNVFGGQVAGEFAEEMVAGFKPILDRLAARTQDAATVERLTAALEKAASALDLCEERQWAAEARAALSSATSARGE